MQSSQSVESEVGRDPKIEKQGKVPKGIVTTTAAQLKKQKKEAKKTKSKSARFLFDQTETSDAPRNVYRETVTDVDHDTQEWIWYHCDDSSYIGRSPILEQKKNSEQMILKGYDYNIPYTPENAEKIKKLATPLTKFYRKHLAQRQQIKAQDF